MRIPPAVAALAIATAVAMLAIPSTASAAWSRVTEAAGEITDDPAVLRGPEGALHVAYVIPTAPGSDQYLMRHTALAANGSAWTTPTTIAGPWPSIEEPDLEVIGGTLYAFWAGNPGVGIDDSSYRAWYASYTNGVWTTAANPMTRRFVASSGVASTVAADGSPWIAWSLTNDLGVHAGFEAGTVDEPNYAGPQQGTEVNIARDLKTGEIHVLTESLVQGYRGVWSRRVAPTVGESMLLSSPALAADGSFYRAAKVPAAAPLTGGVFTATCDVRRSDRYKSCLRIRVSGTDGRTLFRELPGTMPGSARSIWVTPDPRGRLWLVWALVDKTVWASRTNVALTKWSPIRRVGALKDGASLWTMSADATTGPVDVIMNVSARSDEKPFLYHTRVRPQLSVQVVSRRRNSQGKPVLTVRVNDAGDGLRGVVRIGRLRGTSANSGLIRFVLSPSTRSGARVRVVATRTGYVAGATNVRIP